MKRAIAAIALTVATLGLTGSTAGAVPGPDHKNAFPVECQTGTLQGETLTVVTSKWVYDDAGNLLRLTALRTEFDGKVKDQQFGKTQGTLTCGGSETGPEGTFSFFATLAPV